MFLSNPPLLRLQSGVSGGASERASAVYLFFLFIYLERQLGFFCELCGTTWPSKFVKKR